MRKPKSNPEAAKNLTLLKGSKHTQLISIPIVLLHPILFSKRASSKKSEKVLHEDQETSESQQK